MFPRPLVLLAVALLSAGIRSRLIHYPNENHWILKPQNSLRWYQAVREWLEELVGAGAK